MTKKIELVTLHRVKNYGSVLQAYATQEIFKKYGYEIEILDYYPERYTKKGMLSRIKNQNRWLQKYSILRLFARLIILPSYKKRFNTFNKFLNEYLSLSKTTYYSYEEIKSDIPKADYYVTGSDQVWNSGWNGGIDYSLFWNFSEIEKDKRFAFSASFGKSKLDADEKKITKELLSNYKSISLREKSAVEICEDLNIRNTINVLDPTLLLTSEDWRKISSNKFKSEEYILVYNLNRNKKIDSYAKKLSKKTGLKVKYLSYQLHEFYKFGKMYCNPDVEDFLALIDNAKYIVSDSFHATAFSLIFNKEFIIIYPNKYSTRLQSILEKLGLEDRVAKDDNDLNVINKKIDYESVNKILLKEKEKSINWITKNLKSDNKTIIPIVKRNCCGCEACMNICPKNAIKMVEDDYGFIYPKIDKTKCINCGLCKKVCSYQNDKHDKKPIKSYAAIRKNNDNMLLSSASGGIFATIAHEIIKNNGVIYGCSMEKEDNKLIPKHIRIEDEDNINKLQGSKYVKSVIGEIYKNVKNDLKSGRIVLFSGTPCQVAALKKYLLVSKVDTSNLYTMDLICHGIPSIKMFRDYIDYLEKNINGKITDIYFRDKKYGNKLRGTIYYKLNDSDDIKSKPLYSRLSTYYKMFLFGEIYRENCYSCKYANCNRVGDITIGDFWGCKNECSEWYQKIMTMHKNKPSVSCVLVNNEKGSQLFDSYCKDFEFKETEFDSISKYNKQLTCPSKKPESRKKILSIYKTYGYKSVDRYVKKKQGLNRFIYHIYYKFK